MAYDAALRQKTYSTTKTSGSDQTVLTPTTGTKLLIHHISMQNATASAMKAYTGTDGVTTRLINGDFAAGGGQAKTYKFGKYAVAVNDVLKVTVSAGTAYITVEYEEE